MNNNKHDLAVFLKKCHFQPLSFLGISRKIGTAAQAITEECILTVLLRYYIPVVRDWEQWVL